MSAPWGRAASGWHLAMVAREPDQAMRLARFRGAHPEVVMGSISFGGAWQAVWKAGDTETVVTRYTLRELLNRLYEFFPPGGGGD